ncbi:hypothetical protein [uncultured Sphingomonas sp.]
MTPDDQRIADQRRRSRALVTALILGALVVLIFALAIVKIKAGVAG